MFRPSHRKEVGKTRGTRKRIWCLNVCTYHSNVVFGVRRKRKHGDREEWIMPMSPPGRELLLSINQSINQFMTHRNNNNKTMEDRKKESSSTTSKSNINHPTRSTSKADVNTSPQQLGVAKKNFCRIAGSNCWPFAGSSWKRSDCNERNRSRNSNP